MIIETDHDLQGLKEIGKIVAIARDKAIANVRAGITTKELDEIAREVLESYGAISAPQKDYRFPGYTCISINDEIAHGIPGNRKLVNGDIVNIDVSAFLNGYYGDTGMSVVIGDEESSKQRLCNAAKEALDKGIKAAYAGNKLNQIGKAIYNVATSYGYNVIKNLTGHGIGKKLHEDPEYILNYPDVWDKRTLSEGLVLAIETFVTTGADHVVQCKDGWTLRTPDKTIGAQFEHTVVVTKGEAMILTL